MKNDTDMWVVVGQFGRPHGIKGFISVHSFTEPRENILKYSDWHGKIDGQWQKLNITHAEVNNKSVLVKVADYLNRESVSRLTNVELAVTKDKLPSLKDGEYYWHQLIGMKVMTEKGVSFGTVKEILSTGAHDVLVVQGHKRLLIPYVPDHYIINIDEINATIFVDWDEEF
tara:strand:- start:78 stop:590 length:513 start_codon:yes stop_codon:yes gene_type:complete